MGLRETQELKVLQPQVLREHKVPKAPPEPKDQRALQHQHVLRMTFVAVEIQQRLVSAQVGQQHSILHVLPLLTLVVCLVTLPALTPVRVTTNMLVMH